MTTYNVFIKLLHVLTITIYEYKESKMKNPGSSWCMRHFKVYLIVPECHWCYKEWLQKVRYPLHRN